MKKALFFALFFALGSTVAAWANGIDFTNKGGNVLITTDSGLDVTLGRLHSWNGIVAPPGHALGSVQFSTGALTSGSLAAGGTFSSVGSSFIVNGTSNLLPHHGIIFNGAFTGTIDWTFLGKQNGRLVYELTGTILGTLFNGRTVSGTTTQEFWTTKAQLAQGIIHGMTGTTNLNTAPEPGTLSLLGSGLLGLAFFLRRKIMQV